MRDMVSGSRVHSSETIMLQTGAVRRLHLTVKAFERVSLLPDDKGKIMFSRKKKEITKMTFRKKCLDVWMCQIYFINL